MGSITHASTAPLAGGAKISSNEWNAPHTVTLTAADVGAIANANTASDPWIALDSNVSGAFQIVDVQGTRLIFDFDSTGLNKSGQSIVPVQDNVLVLGQAGNAWASLTLGATPFSLLESSPGVLQLGDARFLLDTSILAPAIQSSVPIGGLTSLTLLDKWDSSGSVGIQLGATSGEFELAAGANFFKFRSDDSFDMEMSSGSGFFGFGGDQNGNAFIDNTDLSIQWSRTANVLGAPTFRLPAIVLGNKDGFTNTVYYLQYVGTGTTGEMVFNPVGAAVCDLGGADANFRDGHFDGTGYFGTSVVVGATPFTFSESSPGVLQLGNPGLLFSLGALLLTVQNISGPAGGGDFIITDDAGSPTRTIDLGGGASGISMTVAGTDVMTLTTAGGSLVVDASGRAVPFSANTQDIGASGQEWRTGYFGTSVAITPVNVSALPASPIAGEKAMVNDATAPAFGVAVTGTGGVTVPVFYDGAQWVVG